jgi:hypothetical protein
LTDGSVRLHRLSIPEGYNISQIAEKVFAAGFCDRQAFIDAAWDENRFKRPVSTPKPLKDFSFRTPIIFPVMYRRSRSSPPWWTALTKHFCRSGKNGRSKWDFPCWKL